MQLEPGEGVEIELLVNEGINFFAFFCTCCCLVDGRFSRKANVLGAVALLAAVVALQAGLLFFTHDQGLVLTFLPLTAYLPVIVGMRVLSRSGFFQTMAAWTLGLLAMYILVFLREVLHGLKGLEADVYRLITLACLLLAVGLLLFVVVRFIREPFRANVMHNDTSWLLLCFPTLMIFLLLSYIDSSLTDVTAWMLILLTALSVFLVIARVLTTTAAAARMQEAQRAITDQLDIQRREYESICKKMELGRAYRHDMRHHLSVLGSLAEGENSKEIASYLDELDERVRETEQETYCENTTVNAVLSSYLGKAKEAGCTVSTNVRIPADLPFDALDVCAILANALENAIDACRDASAAEGRAIELTAVLEDGGKFVVSTANPCDEALSFDEAGLPLVPKREGRGIGLRSIKAVADSYQGLFQCKCEQGSFHLSVVLLSAQKTTLPPLREEKLPAKKRTAVTASFAALCLALGCVPVLQAWKAPENSSSSSPKRSASYDFRWGDTALRLVTPTVELASANAAAGSESQQETALKSASTEQPASQQPVPSSPSGNFSWESGGANSDAHASAPPIVVAPPPPAPNPSPDAPAVDPPDIAEGVDDINKRMEEYVETLREKFFWYVARKYNGYVGMDSTYTTLRNDGELLIIRFETTLNVGGSSEYFRYFMLDMRTGKVMELADLFTQDSDYVSVISSEILRQMTEKVNAGEADYFIPGGIWHESDWFKAIAPDQNFYLNNDNQLVIVFEKYEVAPGKEGVPEFTIPAEVLDGILRQPTLLK